MSGADGEQSDLMLAFDLSSEDESAIQLIEDNARSVVCGYDANMNRLVSCKAEQVDIASKPRTFVPKGRAGNRCALETETMANQRKAGKTRMRTAIKTGDSTP